jgi:hypothetical protein
MTSAAPHSKLWMQAGRLFSCTGRVKSRLACFRLYRQRFSDVPPATRTKLSALYIQRPSSQLKLLEQLDSSFDLVQLDEDTASGFFQHLEKQRVVLPCQAPLTKAAWVEYQRLQGMEGRQARAGSKGSQKVGRAAPYAENVPPLLPLRQHAGPGGIGGSHGGGKVSQVSYSPNS